MVEREMSRAEQAEGEARRVVDVLEQKIRDKESELSRWESRIEEVGAFIT